MKGKPLGEILKELGRLDEADIERALEHQKSHGGLFGEALIVLGLLDPQELEEKPGGETRTVIFRKNPTALWGHF